PGVDTILDYVGFEDLLDGVDFVVTGEGRIDGQSVYGKVPVGLAKRCMTKGVKVIAIVGGMGPEIEKVYDYGIYSIMPTVNTAMPVDVAVAGGRELLIDAADRMFRFIKLGMMVK